MRIALIVVLLVSVGACEPRESAMAPGGESARPPLAHGSVGSHAIAGEWSLIAIDQNPLRSGGTPTLVFENDGRCWGTTGVNRFSSFANFENLDDGWLTLGPAAVTRMAGPPEAMALEKLFLAKLEQISSFRIDGDILHLYAGDSEAATFRKVSSGQGG